MVTMDTSLTPSSLITSRRVILPRRIALLSVHTSPSTSPAPVMPAG